jgi:hypothetical protein
MPYLALSQPGQFEADSSIPIALSGKRACLPAVPIYRPAFPGPTPGLINHDFDISQFNVVPDLYRTVWCNIDEIRKFRFIDIIHSGVGATDMESGIFVSDQARDLVEGFLVPIPIPGCQGELLVAMTDDGDRQAREPLTQRFNMPVDGWYGLLKMVSVATDNFEHHASWRLFERQYLLDRFRLDCGGER